MDGLDRVLTIEETKLRMKDIRDCAVHQHAVIRFGDRGRDEMVIISSALWDEVSARKQDELAAGVSSPYAPFARILRERAGRPAEPLPRRRMPGLADTNDLSAEEMVHFAGEPRRPRRRRSS